jgi:hypothetical protein
VTRSRFIQVLFVLGVAALLAGAAQGRPAHVAATLHSGTTRLDIAATTSLGLGAAGIRLIPVSPARSAGADTLLFPVTGGRVSTGLRGSVASGGGMRVRMGRRTVVVRSFVADLTRRVLTATGGGGRFQLLSLAGLRGDVRGGRVSASATARLTRAGAQAFNRGLHTRIFSAGQVLGVARVSAR